MVKYIVLNGKPYCIRWQSILYCLAKHTILLLKTHCFAKQRNNNGAINFVLSLINCKFAIYYGRVYPYL